MITEGKKYLITTYGWFRTPDGDQANAAWGTAGLLTTEDVFAFKPLRPSTNWFITLGKGKGSMIVAGCQIHYAIECERPKELQGTANCIYFAE